MSKSGNGDIVGIDPAAIEAAFEMPDTATSFEDVAIAAPQQIQSAPASGLSPVEQFYGSADRITQPDAGYYDEFPLPGSAPAAPAPAAPAPAPTPAPIPIFEPVFEPAVRDYRTGPAVDFGLPNIETFDGMDFLQQQLMPDPSMFQINTGYDPIDDRQLELPTFTPYDDTDIRNQLNEMRMAEPVDTSQFLTTADLPTLNQFEPTYLGDQINEIAMSRPVDTSQFLTAADLPTYQQFDPTALQNEITDLRPQIGLLGQAPTPGFQQTTAYAPILDFAIR